MIGNHLIQAFRLLMETDLQPLMQTISHRQWHCAVHRAVTTNWARCQLFVVCTTDPCTSDRAVRSAACLIRCPVCWLQDCKNSVHSVSWLEVVKGVPNQGVPSVDCFVSWGSFFCFSFVFRVYVVFCFVLLVVSTSAIDCLERLVSEMTCYVSSGTLNPTHSLTHTYLMRVV